jgi:hypothetical protein
MVNKCSTTELYPQLCLTAFAFCFDLFKTLLFSFSVSLSVLLKLALVNCTKGFHCDISIYSYNVL